MFILHIGHFLVLEFLYIKNSFTQSMQIHMCLQGIITVSILKLKQIIQSFSLFYNLYNNLI